MAAAATVEQTLSEVGWVAVLATHSAQIGVVRKDPCCPLIVFQDKLELGTHVSLLPGSGGSNGHCPMSIVFT